MFLKISENSQENTYRPWPATLLKKRIQYKCLPANFEKFLRTSSVTASVISLNTVTGWVNSHICKQPCWVILIVRCSWSFRNTQRMDLMDSKLVELLTVSLQIGTLPGTFPLHYFEIFGKTFIQIILNGCFWASGILKVSVYFFGSGSLWRLCVD